MLQTYEKNYLERRFSSLTTCFISLICYIFQLFLETVNLIQIYNSNNFFRSTNLFYLTCYSCWWHANSTHKRLRGWGSEKVFWPLLSK